jgi:hypothetical protein
LLFVLQWQRDEQLQHVDELRLPNDDGEPPHVEVQQFVHAWSADVEAFAPVLLLLPIVHALLTHVDDEPHAPSFSYCRDANRAPTYVHHVSTNELIDVRHYAKTYRELLLSLT